MIVLVEPSQLERYGDGYSLVMRAGEAFDYETPFRAMLAEIAAICGWELQLPAWQRDEDFIEGELRYGDHSLPIYFEHALGYLAVNSADKSQLRALAERLAPLITLAT